MKAYEYQASFVDVWDFIENIFITYKAELQIHIKSYPVIKGSLTFEVVVLDHMALGGVRETARYLYQLPKRPSTSVSGVMLYALNQAMGEMYRNPWDAPTLLRAELVPDA